MVGTITVRRRFLGLILALSMVGCAPEKITRENFNRIKTGMTLAEVEAILGKPENSYQGVVSWSTNHSNTVISVVLDDRGRVSEIDEDNL